MAVNIDDRFLHNTVQPQHNPLARHALRNPEAAVQHSCLRGIPLLRVTVQVKRCIIIFRDFPEGFAVRLRIGPPPAGGYQHLTFFVHDGFRQAAALRLIVQGHEIPLPVQAK
ncbi:hypothetical protein D3C75_627490 [compost metagenome]